MAQNRITVGGWSAVQPTKFNYNFQTTSSEDSGRTLSGKAAITPLFTVEAFDVEYKHLNPAQTSALLQKIVQRPGHAYFSLHYFSPYYGAWRTDQFYVGDGTLEIKTLEEGDEDISEISCSFVGRNKLC